MGIGNTSPASLLLHRFAGVPLDDCVGRGAGLDGAGLDRKRDILRRVAEKYSPATPFDTLATFGGLEIAMMCGAVLEARRLNMVIIADGFIATSAFLTAAEMQPDVLENTLFSHSSDEQGHRLMLQYLKGDPVLHLSLRLGEGTGVALAYPLLCSALAFLNGMSSFEEAAVYDVEKNRSRP
jgi:nicotinate-nucleotide--dimethylbenzimidazole phosphoribosyltransferase